MTTETQTAETTTQTAETTTTTRPATKELSNLDKLIRNMTQPLKFWEYLLNAIITGLVIYGVFKGMDLLVKKIEEVRKSTKTA